MNQNPQPMSVRPEPVEGPTSGGLAFLKVWAKTPHSPSALRQVSLRRRGRVLTKPTTHPSRTNDATKTTGLTSKK